MNLVQRAPCNEEIYSSLFLFSIIGFSADRIVFDMLGRVVFHYQSDNESAGTHDFLLNELTPGVYFCRMITGSTTDTQSFVVIESP